MGNPADIDLKSALERVLEARRDTLGSKNNWAELAGLNESTARTAFSGKNPTLKTLKALAGAAGMAVSDMLDYGAQDWKVRVRARALFSDWTEAELTGLVRLLERRAQPPDAAS